MWIKLIADTRRNLHLAKNEVEVDPKETVAKFRSLIAKVAGCSTNRLSLSRKTDKLRLTEEQRTLQLYNIKDGDTIIVRDLGPQVSWRIVFVCEYLGPLIIHPFLYYFSILQRMVYGQEVIHSSLQKILLTMVCLHYVKREYETLYVHRFSAATMPLFNLFKNCAYYWLLSGTFLAYSVYSPQFASKTRTDGEILIYIPLWLFAELSNFRTHLILRNLRPMGTKDRRIPYGYGFSLMSCPNYFFEILGWLAYAMLARTISSFIFLIVGAAQMWLWAKKKHARYLKEFKDYPRNRYIMLPLLA